MWQSLSGKHAFVFFCVVFVSSDDCVYNKSDRSYYYIDYGDGNKQEQSISGASVIPAEPLKNYGERRDKANKMKSRFSYSGFVFYKEYAV